MPLDKDAHRLPRVTLLRGHTSPETAYVIEDYPYGRRLRCKRRVWVETAAKGAYRGQQRFVAQTTNPKALDEPWNKPHAGQYTQLVYLLVDHGDDDHITHTGVGVWGPAPEQHTKYVLNGMYEQMNEQERRIYDALLDVARWKADREGWEKFTRLVAYLRAHIAEHDALPKRVNDVVTLNDERFYIPSYTYTWPVAVAAACEELLPIMF